MRLLRQSTAVSVLIGPLLDETDAITPETAINAAATDLDFYKGITKSDITDTDSGGSNDIAHVANGYYSLELTAGNTDTLGDFTITCNATGCLPIWEKYTVVPAAVYDALVNGTGNGVRADVQAMLAGVVTSIQSGLSTHSAADVWAAGTRTLTSFGTLAADAATAVWAAGTRTLSSFGTLVADIWANATRTITGTVTVATNNDKTGYSLSVAPPTAAENADAVWDEAIAGHQTAGSTGEALEDASAGGGGTVLYGEDGSIEYVYTVFDTNGTTPLPGVSVYVSADESGTQRSQAKTTNDLGQVQFDLDPGTVYFWRSRHNRTFTDPDEEVVS